jgi:PPOX class probable F420-dependent enzyme
VPTNAAICAWVSATTGARPANLLRSFAVLSHLGEVTRPDGMRHVIRAIGALLGLLTMVVGVWALVSPQGFSEVVNFPPHRHFVHDVGAFQLGIGVTLLLALIWADALMVAFAGYAVGGIAHTVSHVIDHDIGGSSSQTVAIGVLTAMALVALVARWRQLHWVVGAVAAEPATDLAPFNRQKTVVLTTYRRDGTPVGTAVSIAVDGGHAYVRSFEQAWKTRRIRNNAAVMIAPATMRGVPTAPAVAATARRLAGAEYRRAAHALARKYPLLHGVLVPLTHRLGRAKTGRTVHFELTPEPAPRTASAPRSTGTARW